MLFRLCRFVADDLPIRIGLLTDHETVLDLTDAGVTYLRSRQARMAESQFSGNTIVFMSSVGPCIVTGADEREARQWTVRLEIERNRQNVFSGETQVDQLKRSFDELVDYLFRCQEFPNGVCDYRERNA